MGYNKLKIVSAEEAVATVKSGDQKKFKALLWHLAKDLIEIAHPDHKEQLLQKAFERFKSSS